MTVDDGAGAGDDATSVHPPPPKRPRGAADRVRLAHRQVRWTIPLVALFVVAALVAATTDTRWPALHLVLAGATVLVISAVSLMLTVTWSAAPAPSDRLVVLQRTAITVGVAVLVSGRQTQAPTWVPTLGAASYAVGLVLLAWLLVTTVRQGVERRYDVPVAGYAIALVAGTVGAALGTDLLAAPTVAVRDAHRVVNLLGLLGLVVASTLPFFAATVGRSKMSKSATPQRLVALLVVETAALVGATVALLASRGPAAGVALAAYAACIVGVMVLLPRPTRRQLDWAGPRLIGLWCGAVWWVLATVVAAAQTWTGGSPFTDPWLAVLVVVAYGQIVWGSLAYLLPVIRGGGHELLSAGFRLTRSWVGLVAVNVVGLSLVVGLRPVAVAALAVWVLDTLVRFSLLAARRRVAPASGSSR